VDRSLCRLGARWRAPYLGPTERTGSTIYPLRNLRSQDCGFEDTSSDLIVSKRAIQSINHSLHSAPDEAAGFGLRDKDPGTRVASELFRRRPVLTVTRSSTAFRTLFISHSECPVLHFQNTLYSCRLLGVIVGSIYSNSDIS
jgi:hypothetical protein